MATVVGVYAIALHRGQGEVDARTLTFTTFMIANLGLIFTNRSWAAGGRRVMPTKNPALAWLTATVPVFLAIVIYVPGLQSLFRFDPLHPVDIAICAVAGVLSVAWFELFKVAANRRAGGASAQTANAPRSSAPGRSQAGEDPPGDADGRATPP